MFTSSGKSTFDKSLEKATSQQLLEPDWDSILAVCDSIRQGDVKAKYALDSIKKKIGHENPNVGKYGLQVLESVVKNCGPPIHQEIATKESMEFLKDLSRAPKVDGQIKAKILELIQAWAHAFRNDSNYKCVTDTYNDMKRDGVNFPEFKESEAMFAAELAPEWKDGDNCYACRVQFTTFVRKHHCRRCGQIFCNKCSAFNSTIPAFGIEKEVRVCEQCFAKLKKLPDVAGKEDSLPAAYLASPLSKQSQLPPKKSEEELREQEELNLAIALSQSEAEAKESEKKRQTANWASYSATSSAPRSDDEPRSSEIIVARAPKLEIDDGVSPELARYLNRDYWEKKQVHQQTLVKTGAAAASQPVTQPSAPDATHTEPRSSVAGGGGGTEVTSADVTVPLQNGGTDTVIDEEFLQVLSSSVDVFVNRMRSDSQRGRSIATDSSVQTLFEALQNMHPRLLGYMHSQEDRRAYHESLQDKLSQLKDARDALTALREEHTERRRREAEERERQRQVVMAQKLDAMRKKKHEYLAHQRQLAILKMQEQERELQARLEQQKQLALMRQMQLHGFPQELQPGYASFQQPMPGIGGGLYYGGGPGPSYMPQQPVGGDVAAGMQYQHPALAGQGPMAGVPMAGPATAAVLSTTMPHQQQQPYPGMGQVPSMQGADAASFRMNDMAANLPPTGLAMQSFAAPTVGVAYGQTGAATATYQQPAPPADSLAGQTYQSPPGTVVAGNNSVAPSIYQTTFYPSQQPQQQQPPMSQAFQPQQLAGTYQPQQLAGAFQPQQLPGAFQQQQQQVYQQPPQQQLQQHQQPPPAPVAPPTSSAMPTYQQPPAVQQQFDSQLIIFD